MFSTKAVVFGHSLIVLIIALRAFPIEDDGMFFLVIFVHVEDPVFYAFKMHRNRAASAGPDKIFSSHLLFICV